MKDSDYNKLIELKNFHSHFIPHNQNAIELNEQSRKGEIITLKEVTFRDISFHRCYFALLNFIYGYMPKKFKETISQDKFYIFLKHIRGDYDILFKFKDGTTFIEYKSISFGKMSQKSFEAFIREQLPYIYNDVLGVYFDGEMLAGIIETIEQEFERYLAKL